jgi:hypothetical protein
MIAHELQAQVQQLLVRRGLTDPSGRWGFEAVFEPGVKTQGVVIRSISEAKVKPYAKWFGEGRLLTIRTGDDLGKEPSIASWEDRGFPFLWMPQSVDASGIDPTLRILDRAFKALSQKLDLRLREISGRPSTAAERAALAEIYFATGGGRLHQTFDEDVSAYTSPEAMRWAAAGIRADLIIYAFARPDSIGYWKQPYEVRAAEGPVFSFEEAEELSDVPLHTVAALYPMAEEVEAA